MLRASLGLISYYKPEGWFARRNLGCDFWAKNRPEGLFWLGV